MSVSKLIVYIQGEKTLPFPRSMEIVYFHAALFSLAVMYGKHLRITLETSLARTQQYLSLGCCCVVWQLLLLIWLSGPAGVSIFTQLASKDLHLSSHDLYSTDLLGFFIYLFSFKLSTEDKTE